MSLWSEHDVVNHHFRYRQNDLLSLFPPNRWEVLRTSYFKLLLPASWLSQKWNQWRKKTSSPTGDLKFGPHWLDVACL